jgi:hypothetical protein
MISHIEPERHGISFLSYSPLCEQVVPNKPQSHVRRHCPFLNVRSISVRVRWFSATGSGWYVPCSPLLPPNLHLEMCSRARYLQDPYRISNTKKNWPFLSEMTLSSHNRQIGETPWSDVRPLKIRSCFNIYIGWYSLGHDRIGYRNVIIYNAKVEKNWRNRGFGIKSLLNEWLLPASHFGYRYLLHKLIAAWDTRPMLNVFCDSAKRPWDSLQKISTKETE